jgi:hypothetical protein
MADGAVVTGRWGLRGSLADRPVTATRTSHVVPARLLAKAGRFAWKLFG